MEFADRREVEHGVEGRDLHHPDRRHVELARDEFHHRDRQPALRPGLRADLALGEVEQGDHRRQLAAFGIARDDLLSGLALAAVHWKFSQRARSSALSRMAAWPAISLSS